ncbi:hypothetical protein GCM10028777_01950 [Angustibacter speluncae]
MSPTPTSARRRTWRAATLAIGAAVATTVSLTAPATAAPDAAATPEAAATAVAPAGSTTFEAGKYVVLLKGEPAIGYEGGVDGLAATKPAEGEDFSATAKATEDYRAHLVRQQDAAIAEAGVDDVTYQYTDAVNGFAADLSADEAAALAKDPSVLAVTKDELRQLDTNASPRFLGLTGTNGVWAQLGGTNDTRKGAGAGTVVGIIDSGIWPENPSFSGQGFGRPTGWNGTCQTGENFPASACNNKLIGARYFVEGFGASNIADYEWLSPRDADGHGTHTASTAAGNDGVKAVVDGRDFGRISGMAPEARIAAYKVCWDGQDGGGGCFGSDSVAAIEAAIADGVDVLNFSISGTSSNYLDAVELAFMYAADAGIFVAASSGNSGPGASTTNHPSPWLTTVAASTHTIYEKTLVTGDGQRFIGSSITEALPTQTPMVLSDAIAASGVATTEAGLCAPDSLDATKAAGTLVVCDRGTYDRVAKSREVARAGGVGMVLVNVVPGSLDNDLHIIPTVHLDDTKRAAVRAYATSAGATGAIVDDTTGSTTQVPEVAGFSSRGPSLGAGGDILKPDIAAPGVGVLAAYSPRGGGRDFDFLSGTSMSSPHIAGLAALVKDAHPDWSPMAIKSAMMTTAREHASAASNDVFAGGAGFVNPRKFLNPGLVYDADQDDWWAFLAGQGVTYSDGTPVSENPIDASDLNQASIASGSVTGTQTITRTITNVGPPAAFAGRVTGLPGFDAKISPRRVALDTGESATVQITFTRTSAAFGQYSQGQLVWNDGRGTNAKSPIALRPVPLAAPGEVTVTDGQTTSVEVTPGFTGTLTTQVKGLTAGVVTEQTAQNTGGAAFSPTDPRNVRQSFTVPAGTTLTRVELRANDPANDDLDLFLQDATTGAVVAQAATGAADEQITSVSLPAGEYVIHVQAWAVAGNAPTTTFDVRTFTVPDADAGNLAVAPASQAVTTGVPVSVGLTPTGLTAPPYLGWVGFYTGSTLAGRTIVSNG